MAVEIEQVCEGGENYWLVSDDNGNEEAFDSFDEAVSWAEQLQEYSDEADELLARYDEEGPSPEVDFSKYHDC